MEKKEKLVDRYACVDHSFHIIQSREGTVGIMVSESPSQCKQSETLGLSKICEYTVTTSQSLALQGKFRQGLWNAVDDLPVGGAMMV